MNNVSPVSVEVATMAAQQDQELECLHGGPPRPPWLR